MVNQTSLLGKLLFFSLCFIILLSTGSGVVSAQNEASFEDGYVVEQQGDILKTTILLNNTNTASMQMTAATGDYSTAIEVSDESGDGKVTVMFDTLQADNPADAFQPAVEDDEISVLNRGVDTSKPSILPTGRYNLIVSSGTTRVAGIVWIESATVHGSTSCASPADTSPMEIDCDGTSSDQHPTMSTTAVAAGDSASVQYHVSGIESNLRSDHLENQLIFANDSTPNLQTTHILQFSPNETTTESRSLRVSYESGVGEILRGSELIKQIGIDTNGNGEIDRSLKISVIGYNVNSNNDLSILFDRSVSLADNQTLLIEYGVVNPETIDTDEVEVTFGNEVAKGTIRYGPEGQGTLGSGLGLRIRGTGTDIVSPLQALDVDHDSETDTLNVIADTEHLNPGTYTIELTLASEVHSHYGRVVLQEQVRIVEPSIHNLSVSTTNGQLNISAQTNLAPDTPLFIEMKSSQDRLRFLSLRQTTVQSDGTISYLFKPPVDGEVSISLKRNDTTVAGPAKVHVENSTG